jgi:hypothetical protein
MLCDIHSQPLNTSWRWQLLLGINDETLSVAMPISNHDSSLVAIAPVKANF